MTTYKLPPPAQKILEILKKAGFEAYTVGGSVRDMIMNRPTKNWDFTTNATPTEILKVFKEGFYNNIFGTVGVPQESGEIYEITTYRTEESYTNRRHPDIVKWGKDLREDLARRDFTINALAFEGKKLIDPFQGQKDIENKIIRAVGEPQKRFQEDALRLLRAIRIASEIGFLIEEKTFAAIKKNASLIKKISGERIREEIFKILATSFPADGFSLLRNSGLLAKILPELEKCFGVPQKSPGRHHIYDVGTHSLLSLKNCPSENPSVRFATLLHDVGKPVVFKKDEKGLITFYNHEVISSSIIRNIANRLHLKRQDREKLTTLVRWHQFTVDEFQTDSAIRRFIRRVGQENIKDIFDLRIGDRLGGGCLTATSWRLKKFMQRTIEVQKHTPQVTDLKINGDDVMRILGIRPGPKVGKILTALFNEITQDPQKNEREYLLKKIKQVSKTLV